MATRKPKACGVSLPFASLQLLAPPTRLVSAALWKVLKQRDVMQYGVVEEFVTMACETVPGLLTFRHQGKLALGLRGRLILEIVRTQADMKVLAPHMKRIRAPAVPPTPSTTSVRNDVKIAKTVEGFHSFIEVIVNDPAQREQFFKEEFPMDYGAKFDEELEKLLWEFLIRLDRLLPIPNLAQTVSWLSDAPSVLEECTRSATQPQLLNILLQHQSSVGHLEPAASLPPNMGDSILQSLSLPLSGQIPSDHPTVSKTSGRDETQFLKPLIKCISNKDMPIMNPVSEKVPEADEPNSSKDSTEFTVIKDGDSDEEGCTIRRYRARKRKRLDEESDKDVSGQDSVGKRRRSSNSTKVLAGKDEQINKEELASCMAKLGLNHLRMPKDPALRSLFVSCIMKQPQVTVRDSIVKTSRGGGLSFHKNQMKMSPVIPPMSTRQQGPYPEGAGSDDKENLPAPPGLSSCIRLQRNTALTSSSDDYVADSEDEGTKNFKGRLFMKRYRKTKHGTYVPTLREFCKPRAPRPTLLSTISKGR